MCISEALVRLFVSNCLLLLLKTIAGGTVPPLDLSLTRKKNISVIQSTLAQWLVTRAELEHYASKVQELLKHGELNVQKYKDYSLKEVPQAHIDLESRATSGKSYIVF